MIGSVRRGSNVKKLSTSTQIFLLLAIILTIATKQPVATVIGVTFLWAVTMLGAVVIQVLTGHRSSESVLLPVCLVMGYFVGSVFHLAIGSLTSPRGTVLLIFSAAVISRIWLRRKHHHLPAQHEDRFSNFIAALAVGACVLNFSIDYPWMLGVALCLLSLAATLLLKPTERRSTKVVLVLFCSVLLALGLFLQQPKYWNLQQEEQLLFELLSESLAHFPGKTSIWSSSVQLNYHWFPFPLAGAIKEAGSFRDFTVNSILLPLAIGSVLFCGVASMFLKHSSPKVALISTIAVASVSNIGFVGWDTRFLALPYSANFVLAAAAFFSLLLIHFPSDTARICSQRSVSGFRRYVSPLLLSAVCSFVLVSSKFDFALAPVVGLQLAVIIRWLTHKARGHTCVYALQTVVGSGIGALLAAWLVVGAFSDSSYYGFQDSPRIELSANFMEYWGDLQTLVGRPRVFVAIAVFIGLFCLSVVVLVASINSTKSIHPVSLSLFAVVVASMLGTLLLPYGNMSRIFIRSSVFLALLQLGLLIAWNSSSLVQILSKRRRLLVACLSVEGLLLTQAYFAWSVQGSGSWLAIRIRVSQFLILPLVVCVVICLALIRGVALRETRRQFQPLIPTAPRFRGSLRASTLVVCVITGVLLSAHNYVWSFRFSDAKLNSRGSHYIALPAERKVSEFLRERTPRNGLIAVDTPRSDLELQRLVISTERRFLTMGNFWGFNDSQSQTAARSLQLSRSIAFLTVRDIRALRQAGVTTLLIRNLSVLPNIKPVLGNPAYLSERFAVFIL